MDSVLKSQGLTTGVIFIATSLYGLFLVLSTLSSLILHSQIVTNKRQSSGSVGTSIYLTLGYMLLFVVSSVCIWSRLVSSVLILCTQQSWVLLWIISLHPDLGQTAGNGTTYGAFYYIQAATEVSALVVADWILVSHKCMMT